MTTSIPDPLLLSSWEDAFTNHPIASVRQMERHLRTSLTTNKSHLRSLVGESYRDLLSTAERIISMDASIQSVESHLAETSRNCNYRLLDRKAGNLKTFRERTGKADRMKYVFAAQLRVLQSCPVVISRLVNKDGAGETLVAAKVYVISTLLLKSLSQQGSIPVIETLRRQLSSLRGVLLRHVDQHLASTSLSTSMLLETMNAFSLITSSSCLDVLLHFQNQRLNAISSLFNDTEPTLDNIIQAFTLFHATLEDTLDIFPKCLSDSLAKLKQQALFSSPGLKEISELNIEVHERWIPEDIRQYTRWVKHDDLSLERVQTETRTRTVKILELLLDSLRVALKGEKDVTALVQLRKQIITLWRSNRVKLSALKSENGEEAGEQFRSIVNTRLEAVLQAQAHSLDTLGEWVTSTTSTLHIRPSNDITSLWSPSVVSHDLIRGGLQFKNLIASIAHGEDTHVKLFNSQLIAYLVSITTATTTLRTMLETKDWDPDDDEDDLEIVKEMDKVDADKLEETQKEALKGSYDAFVTSAGLLVTDVETSTDEAAQHRAAFLLRILLKIRSIPPMLDKISIIDLSILGSTLISRLQAQIAVITIRSSLSTFHESLAKRKWAEEVSFVRLWEGLPALPVQPSPGVFKLLYSLVRAMQEVGVDLWSVEAVAAVKKHMSGEVWEVVKAALEGLEVLPSTNGINGEVKKEVTEETPKLVENDDEAVSPSTQPIALQIPVSVNYTDEDISPSSSAIPSFSFPPSTPLSKSRAIQMLFDMSYLDNAFRVSSSTPEDGNGDGKGGEHVVLAWEYYELVQGKFGEIGIGDDVRERIGQSAEGCWGRTGLLFGVLDGR